MNTPHQSRTHAQLRQAAEFRLKEASTPGNQGWTLGTAALTLLHGLSSDPATAGDALKLLHELQVHQVELDLQHEHMEENRQALEESARFYEELYNLAPVAYVTVDNANKIIEGNLAAARMLNVECDELEGRGVDELVMPDSQPALLAMLVEVRSSGLRHSFRGQAADADGLKWLQVAASTSSCGQICKVVVMDSSDSHT